MYVIGLDEPGSYAIPRSQKNLVMSVTSTGLVGLDTPPALVQADDPGEVSSWNAASGTFTADWQWAGCCTDGAVIGPFPSEAFTLTMTITAYGIPAANAIQVGTYNASGNEVLFQSANLGTAPYAIRLSAFTTAGFCNSFTRLNIGF